MGTLLDRLNSSGTVDAVITYDTVDAAFIKANASYDSQNTTGVYANTAFLHANASYSLANMIASNSSSTMAYLTANAAFIQANTATDYANSSSSYANSAYVSQNTTGIYANSAYIHANSSYISQNTTGSYSNSAFNKANTADQRAVTSGSYANSAYAQANTATTNVVAFSSYANSAYNQANTGIQYAQSAGSYANSAYTQANTGTILAQAAFNVANLANTLSVNTASQYNWTDSHTFNSNVTFNGYVGQYGTILDRFENVGSNGQTLVSDSSGKVVWSNVSSISTANNEWTAEFTNFINLNLPGKTSASLGIPLATWDGNEQFRFVVDDRNNIGIGYAAGLGWWGVGGDIETWTTNSIAIGWNAANADIPQGSSAIAIGTNDVGYGQKDCSIAIGSGAGWADVDPLGLNSIAIGKNAAFTSGHDYSIILNASGEDLSSSNTGLYILPIRSVNYTGNVLVHNDITGEVFCNDYLTIASLGVGTTASATIGEIRATNEITAYYSSDENLKENIVPIKDALGKLKQLQGVMYDWKDDVIESRGGEDGYFVRKHDTGLIAQDVEKVLPEVVATREDGYKAVRYEKMAGLIIQAINELSDKFEQLESKMPK